MIIGLSGYARSGKDTVAEILTSEYDYTRMAFADPLREFLYALNPVVSVKTHYDEHTGIDITKVRLKSVIDEHGWAKYKETEHGAEIRRLLQNLGTDAGREVLGEMIWVDTAFKRASDAAFGKTEDTNLVITDCRFPNEARAVKEYGGLVVRVNRDGYGPINDHISEVALDDWPFDVILANRGSLEEFQNLIRVWKEEGVH